MESWHLHGRSADRMHLLQTWLRAESINSISEQRKISGVGIACLEDEWLVEHNHLQQV